MILKETDYLDIIEEQFAKTKEHKILVSAISIIDTRIRFKYVLNNIKQKFSLTLCKSLETKIEKQQLQ